MKADGTQFAIGAGLLGAFVAFWRWHSPRVKPLTTQEIDRYLETISKLPLPEGHIEPIVDSLRAWAEADDGKPVLMLNMIRFYEENRSWPGAPEFRGTPREANAHYEKSITPLWLRNASYPIAGGDVQGENLIKTLSDQGPWDAAKMVRYPSRRMFLQLLSDPSYGPYEPYKFMSMEIDLVPVKATVIPDARWIAGGGLLALFLAAGWKRAARR
jgi:hypothetical protein